MNDSIQALAGLIWTATLQGGNLPADESQILIRPWKSEAGLPYIEAKQTDSALPSQFKLSWFIQPGTSHF